MPSPATLPEDLLNPIRKDKPAGTDLRATRDWPAIRDAKPDPYAGDQGQWTKQSPSDVSWPRFLDMTAEALRSKSKDLEIAIWLTEASTRLNGFPGARDSLALVRKLILQFWDSGLFPSAENGETGKRRGSLLWLNDKLAEVILEIPLTARGEPGLNYSYAYFLESRRSGGSITVEQFEEASRLTPLEHFQTLCEDCQLAQDELARLQEVTDEKFSKAKISYLHSKAALEESLAFLKNRVAKRGQIASGTGASGPLPDELKPTEGSPISGFDDSPSGDTWDKAERMVREGNLTEGLAEMTRLAATAPNGRDRFHRKLLLADICLKSKREALAKSILEELAELIDKHHLEEWESPRVAGAVWSRLYRCYKNEQAGIADTSKAAEFLLKLCRLDPWQALACSDGK